MSFERRCSMESFHFNEGLGDFEHTNVKIDHPLRNPQRIYSELKHRMAVQKALEMIQTKMQDRPSLGELAASTGMSRTYFSHIFRHVMGMRLQEYLMTARLHKAKDLLGDNSLKVKQIAFKVGFRDPNYFCRTFKKKVGLSPIN